MHVYWIRHPDHTDIFRQGYIGVSDKPAERWAYHKKRQENNHLRNAINMYGWDVLLKETVLIGDKDYCLYIESKLRPEDKTGWNIVKGGGLPPNFNGQKRSAEFVAKARLRKDSEETRRKKSLAKIGNKSNLGKKMSDETRAKIGAKSKGNKYCSGKQNGLKYRLIGTNILDGTKVVFLGAKQTRDAGFHYSHVLECCDGKVKTHKGYTWNKELLNG